MKRALITTTINTPYNLQSWRASGMSNDDVVIVVGDEKTPHTEVRALLETLPGENVYLDPSQQTRWESSRAIGWNCIQRRNIALLEAIKYDTDYIITVDDDNFPVDENYMQQLDAAFSGENTKVVSSDSGWFNAGSLLSPSVVARGYPFSQRHVEARNTFTNRESEQRIGVVASLWLGEPDIDAVERICCAPDVTHMVVDTNIALAHNTWCPFNTQSTAFRTMFAPFMMVWPHVGRYDDIWASYLTQRVMETSGYHVSFGRPLVRQDRNPHNLVRDLQAELLGMEKTDELAAALRDLPNYGEITTLRTAVSVLDTWYDILVQIPWLSSETCNTFDAWINDLVDIMGEIK